MANEAINFTNKKIESLKADLKKDRIYFADTKIEGLVLMITKKGTKSFQVYRKFKGRPLRVTIGKFPSYKCEQARNEAMKILTQMNDGINPNEEKKKLSKEAVFNELFEVYMNKHSRVHKKSWKYDEEQHERYIKNVIGKLRVSQVTRDKLEQFQRNLASTSGKIAANRSISLISSVFGKAIEWEVIAQDNPTRFIKKFPEKSRDRFLQPSEIPKFFEALNMEYNEIARDAIFMMILTGARKSNVLKMKWEEISLQEGIWRISEDESKNAEAIHVPLTPQAVEILEIRRKATNKEYVFPGTGKVGHLADPKKAWKRVLQNATILIWQEDARALQVIQQIKGSLSHELSVQSKMDIIKAEAKKSGISLPKGIMDMRIHDLRRTLGSWQTSTGANAMIVGKTLGHKSQAATAIYSRLNIDPVRESVEKATAAMFEVGKKVK